jgi:error-prone DNA polymerase
MNYFELNCKSNFSFLMGASFPEELVQKAAESGLSGIALTDNNGVYGLPRAWQAGKDFEGFKVINGAELTLLDKPPITLLAQDRAGYGLLCRMLTAAHADKPKGEAGMEWPQFLAFAQEPAAKGLTVMTKVEQGIQFEILNELFKGRYYLTLSRHLLNDDRNKNRETLEISQKFGVPIVACNDVLFHKPKRRMLQDVMTCIREGATLKTAGYKLSPNGERYIKTPAQMAQLFADMPDALHRTMEIAERCTFSFSEIRYRYPSEWIPKGISAQNYMEELVWKGAKWRYPEGTPENVVIQLKHEMGLVEQLQFADYFLTIYEICEFARSRNILFQGRGSAANSVVCYCLGITSIDPVRMKLLFERFISVERNEPPDIDVDFEHERREEVIQHLYEKYGRHRAAMVSAVVTYQSRLALQDVSKALGVPKEGKHNPEGRGVYALDKTVQKMCEEIAGFPRHLSIHSGGFVLTADALIETVPVEPARMEGRTICQWDKNDLDVIGLLKIDVLALGMLTALHKTMNMAGIKELAHIPAEDEPTYEMLRNGDAIGTFQVESRAQINMLGRLKPKNFYDLVIEIALVRPGPIVGKMVHPYLKRRKGEVAMTYSDPRIEEILGRTLGVPLFQEQVMKLAIVLAKFTAGEADKLRRAIAAWRSSGSVLEIGKKLLEGLLSSGVPKDFALQIFEQIKGFAEYGFPESHAASFALLTYASAYLKRHHQAEFTCALVNSEPLGFYSVHTLIDDAKRAGVTILPLNPHVSVWDCQIEDKAIRLGWRVVNRLAEQKAQFIELERSNKPFENLWDFLNRTKLPSLVLHSLALGGAFDSFGTDRRQATWTILAWENLSKSKVETQLNFFPNLKTDSDNTITFKSLDTFETVREDYASYGLSLTAHPMEALRTKIMGLSGHRTKDAKEGRHGQVFSVSGLVVVRQRPATGNGTVFASLEDEHGLLDLILHKSFYQKHRDVFNGYSFITVKGILQRDGNSSSLLLKGLSPIAGTAGNVATEELNQVGSRNWH